PSLATQYRFGVWVQEAGRCRDPGAYVGALIAYAREMGAAWVRGRVIELRVERGRLREVVLEDGGRLACDAAVIAAGVRSRALSATIGCRVPLVAERGYHVMLDLPGAEPHVSMML